MDENDTRSESPRRLVKMGILVAILGLLAALTSANYLKARSREVIKDSCVDNLRQLDGAKAQWALENNQTNMAATVGWTELQPYLGRCGDLNTIFCPSDSTKRYSNSYTLGSLGTKPQCKIQPLTHKID